MASKQARQARERARQPARRRRRQAGPQAAAAHGSQQPSGQGDPLIGYVARSGPWFLCDGDGCIVAATRENMQQILRRLQPKQAEMYTMQAAPFSHIVAGMRYGGAYCFDQEAYGRFLTPGRRIGMPLTDEDFSDPGPMGMHFVRAEWLGFGSRGPNG